MNLFTIAFKNLRQRQLASLLTGLSVALGVALMVSVLILNNVVTKLFSQTGTGYDLVIGAKGSPLQLVLSTVYRIDRPIENLPWRFYKQLSEDARVERAIPINIGDTTDQGNFPIVGTTPQYFLIDYVPGKKFLVKGDGLRGTWDAVIGSQVAKVNNWSVGSTFKLIHSGADDHVHDELFTVRGVLAPTGTPNDRTAFIHIDGFFQLDEHSKPVDEAIAREADFFGETQDEVIERYRDDILEMRRHEAEDHSGHHHHHGPMSDLQKEVTGVFVVMSGGKDPNPQSQDLGRASRASSLSVELNKGFKAQAVNVVFVMRRLLNDLVGNIRFAFMAMTALIIAVSGIGIFVSIYNSMSERRREIAVMRALGASRQTVLLIIMSESLLLCLLGGLLGLILGHGLIFIAAPIIEARSGLLIDPLAFSAEELKIFPVLMVMAVLIGILPGLTAYRTDVAQSLQS